MAQLVGPVVATLTLELHGDQTMDGIFGGYMTDSTPTTRSIQLGPYGTTSGLPKYTAECYISEYEPEEDAEDPAKMSATLVVDATGMTRGTF